MKKTLTFIDLIAPLGRTFIEVALIHERQFRLNRPDLMSEAEYNDRWLEKFKKDWDEQGEP